jgi:hypothetical protein
LSSVSAPRPDVTQANLIREPDGVLAKRVITGGRCAPGAISVVLIELAVAPGVDPWFPVDDAGRPTENGDNAVLAAERACSGCPVKDECLELARREELRTGDIHGVRGGLTATQRRATYRAAAAQGGDAR